MWSKLLFASSSLCPPLKAAQFFHNGGVHLMFGADFAPSAKAGALNSSFLLLIQDFPWGFPWWWHGHTVLQSWPKALREAGCIIQLLEGRHKCNPLAFAWLEFLRKWFYLYSDGSVQRYWECKKQMSEGGLPGFLWPVTVLLEEWTREWV